MIVAIHQPEHLPWYGFFSKVIHVDTLVILDTVPYRKNYFGNRNRLLGPQGPFWVTVPVHLENHLEGQYRTVEIAEDAHWRRRYWKSLYYNYKNHPFFPMYAPFFEETLQQTWKHLAAFNEVLIRRLIDDFGIQVRVVRASNLEAAGSGLCSTDRLVAICREVGADCYLAGQLGHTYMDEARFAEACIEVRHLKLTHPVYPQFGRSDFVPELSALDLLMNCGTDSLEILEQAGKCE